MDQALLIALASVNLLAFLAFGWDKWRAIRGGSRTPEKTLLTLALCMGAAGAWLGVKVFRHKSSKPSFLWRLILVTVVNLAAVGAWLWVRYGERLSEGG